ncbi:hypothetical protein TCON_2423 [Astathelohania contejeani]|uniref:t-SNARE coiled-coil homology domain-containing protein n=1 Tax=Astathelohania contejeani TaxID=164912 RepID=A0ABQ7HW25_9MICR|nr:hypothetical protein TCON_2423 [Thelohania contejeani]
MFDSEYFQELLSETSNLIKNSTIDSLEELNETNIRIESNITTLRILAQDIDDIDTRNTIIERINKIYETKEFEFDFKLKNRNKGIETAETDEIKKRLERDLLNYTKILRERVEKFNEKIEEDSKIVDKVENVFTSNVEGVEYNLSNLKKEIQEMSPFRLLMLAFMIFIFMYLIIRFL